MSRIIEVVTRRRLCRVLLDEWDYGQGLPLAPCTEPTMSPARSRADSWLRGEGAIDRVARNSMNSRICCCRSGDSISNFSSINAVVELTIGLTMIWWLYYSKMAFGIENGECRQVLFNSQFSGKLYDEAGVSSWGIR